MVRLHATLRTLAALVLLAVAAVGLAALGRWQLQRGDERRALAAVIEAGRQAEPLDLTPAVAPQALTAWRSAQAVGCWLADKTVLIDNRNYAGRPGYWVATPLLLNARGVDDAAGEGLAGVSLPGVCAPHDRAVLVLRGWLPRVLSSDTPPTAPLLPGGKQHIQGELAVHVPRLFELGGGRYSRLPTPWPMIGPAPLVQNLGLEDYERATGLSLMPIVLQQLRPSDDGLVRQWPEPSTDHHQNQGYALQWFAFAAIATGAFLVVAVRALKRRRPNA